MNYGEQNPLINVPRAFILQTDRRSHIKKKDYTKEYLNTSDYLNRLIMYLNNDIDCSLYRTLYSNDNTFRSLLKREET